MNPFQVPISALKSLKLKFSGQPHAKVAGAAGHLSEEDSRLGAFGGFLGLRKLS